MKGIAMKFDIDDFFPTPANLICDMLFGVKLDKVHTILEPSAGKGDIAKYVQKMRDGYNRHPFDIDTIEIDTDLQHVLKGENFRVVHNDFLAFDTFKRYDLVIMNPPFSSGDRHLLHALGFVKGDGQLVCLLNAETLKNPYTKTRQDLSRRLSDLKADIRFVELAFADAERQTDVEIAIVRIDMPEDGADSVILDHLRPAQDDRPPFDEPGNPLVSSDHIRALVAHFANEAETGVRLIREYHAISRFMLKGARERKAILELTVKDQHITEKDGHRRDTETNFLMSLRHRYWETLFTVPEFTDKLTSDVQKDLHSRVHEFAHYDFSFHNIYSLYLEVSKALLSNIKKAIFDLFEDFTHRHHYAEYSKNVHYYDGWKTNKAFKVNKKVIIPFYISDFYWDWGQGDQFRLPWEMTAKLCDIEKVFDYLAGTSAASHTGLAHALDTAGNEGQRRGIEARYFKISIFKKGTCHIEFKDPELVKIIQHLRLPAKRLAATRIRRDAIRRPRPRGPRRGGFLRRQGKLRADRPPVQLLPTVRHRYAHAPPRRIARGNRTGALFKHSVPSAGVFSLIHPIRKEESW